jgi:hypothetical protein
MGYRQYPLRDYPLAVLKEKLARAMNQVFQFKTGPRQRGVIKNVASVAKPRWPEA